MTQSPIPRVTLLRHCPIVYNDGYGAGEHYTLTKMFMTMLGNYWNYVVIILYKVTTDAMGT